jgi:hypothetical protein
MNKILVLAGCLICLMHLNIFCSNSTRNKADTVAVNGCDTSYKVYRIDSINNFYLIYASKSNIRYKIISKKQSAETKTKVRKGGCYDFELFGMLSNEDVMPGPGGCVNVDSITRICIEDSIYNLYSASNLKGLYFEKK